MPTVPTTVTLTGTGFEPAFRRVQQDGDFDCAFAVVAMIANIRLFDHPAHGMYRITGELIANLLEHYGYEAGMYEEPASVSDIPDLAMALVDYDELTNFGRHVLFHRAHASHDPTIKVEYVVDPAYWIESQDYVRWSLSDIQWFLGVRVMKARES
jgi:hypothetical protein